MTEPVGEAASERSLWDRFWRNESGELVILQPPNPPLLGWLLFSGTARAFSNGAAHAGLSFLSKAFLFTWAYLEVTDGDSGFRRVLGAVVAISIATAAFR